MGTTRIILELAPAVTDLLEEIKADTGDTTADVFRKALSLYKVALDAVDDGKHVGAVSDEGVLEIEFVGF